jgi:hypothetical protein
MRVGLPVVHPMHLLPTMDAQLSLVPVDCSSDCSAHVLEGPNCHWYHVMIVRDISLLPRLVNNTGQHDTLIDCFLQHGGFKISRAVVMSDSANM